MAVLEARPTPPPSIAAGQSVDAGQWAIEVETIDAGTTLPDGRRSTAGRGALMLTAKLTNRTGTSTSDFLQAIKLTTPIPGIDDKPTVYLLRDRTYLRQLHPGLAERVTYVWTYPLTAKLPQKARFELVARKYKPRDNLYAASGWFNPSVVGTIELPLATDSASLVPAVQ